MANDLDDPRYAAFAWRRYRRLLVGMAVVAAIAAGLGPVALRLLVGPVSAFMTIATAVAIFVTIMIAAVLMGLVFLSSGSGHDDTIHDPFEGRQ